MPPSSARTLLGAVEASRRWRPDSVAVRSILGPPTSQDVVAEITRPAGEGNGGYARRVRSGVYRTIRMPVFDRFVAARREAMPAAYLVPTRFNDIITLLRRQGIQVGRLLRPWTGPAERFAVDTLLVEPLFEGHRTVRAEGRWSSSDMKAEAGVVRRLDRSAARPAGGLPAGAGLRRRDRDLEPPRSGAGPSRGIPDPPLAPGAPRARRRAAVPVT